MLASILVRCSCFAGSFFLAVGASALEREAGLTLGGSRVRLLRDKTCMQEKQNQQSGKRFHSILMQLSDASCLH